MVGSYAFCAGFAGSGLKNAEFGYIPFVGPFIAMAKVELPYKGDTTVASFIVSGIGEVAGAAVLIYGLISTERWVVQNKKKAAAWTLAPNIGKSGGGLGVVGRF